MLELRYQEELLLEAGCDEAGRGCLAGSVFGAAVILPRDFYHPLLNDSKKLTPRKREMLRPIIEREAVAWCVAEVSAERIDEINILNAAHESMSRAVEGLSVAPDMILVDGNLFRTHLVQPHVCIVGGDATYASIAAASILAKTHRDEYMEQLAREYPEYNWAKNKGYPTSDHRAAIERYGLSPLHRTTFKTKR